MQSAIVYDQRVESSTIHGHGNFEEFVVPSRTYETGIGRLEMSTFRNMRVLDFSIVFKTLFRQSNDAPTLFLRVEKFLQPQWVRINSFDLYLLPIDKLAKQQGRKADLPNVTFALTVLMMRHAKNFIIVDPMYHGTDSHVKIVNFSRVLQSLQDDTSCRISTARNCTPTCPEDAAAMILYQRGNGKPDAQTTKLLCDATQLSKHNIVRVQLTPGKYTRDTGRPTIIYKEFETSVATILHELACIDTFVQRINKRTLHKVYFAMDEFSAYAAYSAIAMIGYGIETHVSILCYHRGKYAVS